MGEFLNSNEKGKFAGNIKATASGYQTDTAGLDCSGFVSSTAGFSYIVKSDIYKTAGEESYMIAAFFSRSEKV